MKRRERREPISVAGRQMAPVMTIDEARQVLRMQKQRVYDMIRSGALVTFRRGRARYVTDESLREAIRQMESAGRAGTDVGVSPVVEAARAKRQA